MKHLLLVWFMAVSIAAIGQQNPILEPPKVDQRVELMSIVFRLADSREYSSQRFPEYVAAITDHFESYKGHELITYIKKKLRKRGIGFDAVMHMAIAISDDHPFTPLVPFSDKIPEARWGKKSATKFLALLNQFYQDANCATFFKEQEGLYTASAQRFKEVYEELDLDWYQSFYGQEPKGEFRIVNGLGNGGSNYGPNISVNGEELVYAIMGTWSVDSVGMPVYKVADYFPTLLHEFNHSFVNHVVEAYHGQLAHSGQILFEPLEARMNTQAYGDWEVMYAEAVVRAAVIKYLIDHHYETALIEAELQEQIDRGFLWTNRLVAELERYDQSRDQYPTLESFMPELVTFFDQMAENVEEIKLIVAAKKPTVIALKPFENGSQRVDPSLTQLEIVFDKPLTGRGYSVNYGAKGKKYFPDLKEITYSDDKTSVFLEVDLQADQEYQLVLTGRRFQSAAGYGMEDYEISFKTTEEPVSSTD